MTCVLKAALLGTVIVGATTLSATAAPISPSAAPALAHRQVEKVHERHYYHRRYYYRRAYRPHAYVYYGPRYSYRRYYRDYDYHPYGYATIGVPFFSFGIGHHHHRHYRW